MCKTDNNPAKRPISLIFSLLIEWVCVLINVGLVNMLLYLLFDIRHTQKPMWCYPCYPQTLHILLKIFVRIANSITVRPFNMKVNQNKFLFMLKRELKMKKNSTDYCRSARQNIIYLDFLLEASHKLNRKRFHVYHK